MRLDVKSGEHTIWEEEGTYPGEPIFVPRPGGTKEDDGVLLSVVLAGLYSADLSSRPLVYVCWGNLTCGVGHLHYFAVGRPFGCFGMLLGCFALCHTYTFGRSEKSRGLLHD